MKEMYLQLVSYLSIIDNPILYVFSHRIHNRVV